MKAALSSLLLLAPLSSAHNSQTFASLDHDLLQATLHLQFDKAQKELAGTSPNPRHLAGMVTAVSSAPQQVHLALTGNPGEMAVTWVTLDPSSITSPFVTFWPTANASATSTVVPSGPGSQLTYQGFESPWNGTVFHALMSDLQPAGNYSYLVGYQSIANGSVISSPVRSFLAPSAASPSAVSRIAVTADMGTYAILGWAVCDALEAEVQKNGAFDMYLLAGDVAYATLDPGKELEDQMVWDMFGVQVEPFASTSPLMMAAGNQ